MDKNEKKNGKKNEIVIRPPAKLVTAKSQHPLFDETQEVRYALVDSSRYTFEYNFNDNINVNMFESDRTYESNEFVDAEFEDTVSEADLSYYTVAAASGLLTGTLSQLNISKEALKKINEWKDKDWEKYIVLASNISGYKKGDINGALSFLKDRFVTFSDEQLNTEFQSGLNAWFEMLSSHPSAAGLVFSFFTQYSRKKYKLGEKGLETEAVPEYYAVGRNIAEKCVYSFLYWAFYLAMDVIVSDMPLLDDMKMPKEVIKLLKDLYKLPIFASLPHSVEDAEKLFSEWLINIFEKSEYTNEENEPVSFDLKDIIKKLGNAVKQDISVLINECLVRSFYLIKKLIIEIKDKNIRSFEELNRIDVENILPFNNRLVSRMIMISSGCFMCVNVIGATVKAILKGKKNSGDFAKALLAEVNIAGVGRFVFACISDAKYWGDDIDIFFQRMEKGKKKHQAERNSTETVFNDDVFTNETFNVLALNPTQTKALYSLENMVILSDIEHTKDDDVKQKKQLWMNSWHERIQSGIGIDFCADEKVIYSTLNTVEQTDENLRWLYLLASELILFKPYYPLGTLDDSEFKKLQLEKYNYIDDQFARKQTIVIQKEIDSIRDAYKKYRGIISGNTQNKIIAAGVTAVAAVATGGVALTFAPGIATLIAGEAVVGLHGAALTSASLAFVGGGSLAAGGMGMAGGTAIITGGGALLGIAGSGSASMAAILSQTSSEYWLRQTTKLTVYSKCVLKDRLEDTDAIKGLSRIIAEDINKIEKNIAEIDSEKCSLDKEVLKNAKDFVKYLNRCKSELDKMI